MTGSTVLLIMFVAGVLAISILLRRPRYTDEDIIIVIPERRRGIGCLGTLLFIIAMLLTLLVVRSLPPSAF